MKSEGSRLPWESALLLAVMTVHLMGSDFVPVQVGWGLSHSMDLSEAGDVVCGSLLSVIFCLVIWYMGRKEGAPGC